MFNAAELALVLLTVFPSARTVLVFSSRYYRIVYIGVYARVYWPFHLVVHLLLLSRVLVRAPVVVVARVKRGPSGV